MVEYLDTENPVVMKKLLKDVGQALRDLRKECHNLGEIVETPHSVVWRGFYGCSYYRANYEENVTPCVIFESYWDSSEEGSTVGFQSKEEAEEHIAGRKEWVLENQRGVLEVYSN